MLVGETGVGAVQVLLVDALCRWDGLIIEVHFLNLGCSGGGDGGGGGGGRGRCRGERLQLFFNEHINFIWITKERARLVSRD